MTKRLLLILSILALPFAASASIESIKLCRFGLLWVAHDPHSSLEDLQLINLSKQNEIALIESRGRPAQRKIHLQTLEKMIDEEWGAAPRFIQSASVSNQRFRRYLPPGQLDKVLETHRITASFQTYAPTTQFHQTTYRELAGIFITLPQFSAKQTGIDDGVEYDTIDFDLYDGTGLVQVNDREWLVPGMPGLAGWIKDAFLKYEVDGSLPTYASSLAELFERIRLAAGINPIEIPIKNIEVVKRVRIKR